MAAAAVALMLGSTSPAALGQGIAGPYLAANQADSRDDFDAAAIYYDRTLEALPENPVLLNNALIANIAAGRMDRALELAGPLQEVEPDSQLAALVQLAEALAAEDYSTSLAITRDERFGLNPLFGSLVQGWALVGQGDFNGGAEVFRSMAGNETMEAYGQMAEALALAFAGDFASAATILDGDERGPLHLDRLSIVTHVVALAQSDRRGDALALVNDLIAGGMDDAQIEGLRDRLESGEDLPYDQIGSAADGAAGVFGIMAGALGREQAVRQALVYSRLALRIRPDFDEMRALTGDLLSGAGEYDLAVDAYSRIQPASPWFVTAEIGRAEALARAERTDEATEVLSALARGNPGNQMVQTALGDMLRVNEQFARAADAYTAAIDLIEVENPAQWRLFYVRGIAYERTDRWPEAEADFRRALELNPEQPQVLNYLGYSLVELRRNLEEAEAMIRRAVEQRPQDGYITDSLGWVLYRLGRYEEAVAPMERAVELLPVDPIINDHLGDVLWMVDRKREAEFQWRRALSFEPEPEDAERIRRKLDRGLDAVLAEEEASLGGGMAPTAQGN
ncbi:tetratricopeptide repeat protein [Halovulum dunhuangense]|uniref:Tetratricopeptide repeat protein n=1 Tax=Halovulum dunhuangense TaxID=1505036 RepID=A0A849KVZ1_9RHOB|nr:tetratricopeptide repeat protein [Halovulum dunhuangense]NNU79628.1 tetratricopeptide repeat protein [Halovulum dunhuangense]